MSAAAALPAALSRWLTANADALDGGSADPESVVPELAAHDLFRIGVPEALGGAGGTLGDAVEALAGVAELSLTAAFVLWGQRTFVEYLRASSHAALRERFLKPLLSGDVAGATGLSNALKFLSGIEELQAQLSPLGDALALNGKAPWVTNLRKGGFVVAIVAGAPGGDGQWVLALQGSSHGVERSPDFRLLGLGASNTAALRFDGARVSPAEVLHRDARAFIAQVRPAFLGLQCALSVGLARASLRAAKAGKARGAVLNAQLESAQQRLEQAVRRLGVGLSDESFSLAPRALFELKIELARLAQAAVELELRASGGSAYLTERDGGFARRWREAAFVPIVTPSLAQLEHELARHGGSA